MLMWAENKAGLISNKMEVELSAVTTVPIGLVSSIFIHGAGTSAQYNVSSKSGDVLVSMCPSGRLLTFISSYKAQFVACEETPSLTEGIHPIYQNSFEGLLHIERDVSKPRFDGHHEMATCSIVVPVTLELRDSLQTSSIVIVGFSDGYIRAYSKTGKPIFSYQLHTEQVTEIKVIITGQRRPGTASTPSTLVVLLKNVVCLLDGRVLAEFIKYHVLHLNEGDDASPTEPVQLSYKKYQLTGHSVIHDAALIGQSTPSVYDHLCDASLVGGFDTSIKSGPAPEVRLITVGEQPAAGLYRIKKDSGTLNMTDVVHAVASKMTTAVLGKLSQAGGWLGWGGRGAQVPPQRSKPHEEQQQPTMNLSMNTNIPDHTRSISGLVVSPLGNLAAMADKLGRVLLLEVDTMVVRRIWKGYRDAQCGWLLVRDSSQPQRRAECLCIYAARRGILELWPVQHGGRVGVFQVGKGCRLLYTPHSAFGSEQQLNQSKTPCVMADSAMLLCPDGKLVTINVPFPALVRVSSVHSHDAHLLNKLESAISAGDRATLEDIVTTVKSSISLQKVVVKTVKGYSKSSVPREHVMSVLNIAVARTSSTPNQQITDDVSSYFKALHQLSLLFFAVKDLSSSYHPPSQSTDNTPETLAQLLERLCSLHSGQANRIGRLFADYFQMFSPVKTVTTSLTLSDMLQQIYLPMELTECILPKEGWQRAKKRPGDSCPVPLKLHPDCQHEILGILLFQPILSCSPSVLTDCCFFDSSGLSPQLLLNLLLREWLRGGMSVSKPGSFLVQLYTAIKMVVGNHSDPEIWSQAHSLLSSFSLVGHSLMAALVCQQLACSDTDSDPLAETSKMKDQEVEEWEAVSVEKELWVELIVKLELLTQLSLLTGVSKLRRSPSVLFVSRKMEDEDEEAVLDLSQIKLSMQFEDGSQCVSVLSLDQIGPSLIGLCAGRSLVSRRTPPQLVMEASKQKENTPPVDHVTTVDLLRPLIHSLPQSLSPSYLFLYAAFQAALHWKDGNPEASNGLLSLAVDYSTKLDSLHMTKGMCSFLWHILVEKEVLALSEKMKKVSVSREDRHGELLYAARSLVGFLYQITDVTSETRGDQASERHDIIQLTRPTDKLFVPDIVSSFPQMSPSILKCCLQLLLVLELGTECGAPISGFSYFPATMRNCWRKGLLLSGSHDSQPGKMLQQKRFKFLCNAVSTELEERSQSSPIRPNAIFECLSAVPTDSYTPLQLTSTSRVVFSLAELWEVGADKVRVQWVANLFAAGQGDKAKELFQSVQEKGLHCSVLLSLAGHLTLHILNNMEDKTKQAVLLAQISPTFLEWMRKQKTAQVNSSLLKLQPSLGSLSQLVSSISVPSLSSLLPVVRGLDVSTELKTLLQSMT